MQGKGQSLQPSVTTVGSAMPKPHPYRLKSGKVIWRVQYRVDGKVVTDRFDTEKAANEYCRLIERNDGASARDVLKRRRGNIIETPTLRQWTAQYLDPDSGLLTGIEPGTRHSYTRMARASFLQLLGEYPVDGIMKQDVGKWVAWQEKQPKQRRKDGVYYPIPGTTIAAKTVGNYHALLSNVLKAAKEHGLIQDNPAYRTRLTRGLSRSSVFLSQDQFAALVQAFPDYYKPLVMFLVGSQCRWSEATALQWKHIHTDTTPPTVSVHQAWKKASPDEPARISVPKTKRGRRTIALWPELVIALGEPGAPDDFVFTGPLGGRQFYSPFRKVWDKAITRAGLNPKPTVHDLRHTGASWLIADGKPLPFIQQRLGHESITTTVNTYGHLLPDAQTQMADSMAGIMSNVLPRDALEA